MADKQQSQMPNPAFDHSNDFVVPQEQLQQKAPEVNLEEKFTYAAMAIGKDAPKYLPIFDRIRKGDLIIPSKPAGIFALAWLVYRRASYIALPLYSLLILLSYEFVKLLTFMPDMAKMITIFVIPHVVFFFTGNLIYWMSVRRKVETYKRKYGSTSAMTYLAEQGGTLSGFNLLAPYIMTKGLALVAVYGALFVDNFLDSLWSDFLQLATM